MRETGPVRKELSGEEAAPYIGFARTALGVLKNQMGLGGLLQGKMTRRLPDGTVVTVQSVFGQNKISIEVPAGVEEQKPSEEAVLPEPPPAEEVEVPETLRVEEQIETDFIVVCGTCTDEDNAIFRPFLWMPGQNPIEITGAPGSARAHAISGNGQVVVGSFEIAANDERAFMWTARGGFVDLGNLGGFPSVGGATGVSYDGSVIVGSASDADGTVRCWVWTRTTGIRLLLGSQIDTSQFLPNVPRVSPNGQFICGLRRAQIIGYAFAGSPAVRIQTIGFTPGGMVWRRPAGGGWTGYPLPQGSAYRSNYIDFFTAQPTTWNTPFEIIPYAVNDVGDVVGIAWCGVAVPFGGAPVNLYPPGATPVAHTSPSQVFNPTGPLSRWVAGVSSSGKRVTGDYASSPVDRAWVYTDGGIVDFPQDGAIYAMAPTGLHFAGASGAEEFAYLSVLKRIVPMLWTAKGATAIPLLPGATRGWCDGIAAASIRIPPVPPAPLPLERDSPTSSV